MLQIVIILHKNRADLFYKNDPLANTANVVQADKQVYLGGHREF